MRQATRGHDYQRAIRRRLLRERVTIIVGGVLLACAVFAFLWTLLAFA